LHYFNALKQRGTVPQHVNALPHEKGLSLLVL
jgi:hypothetical protein